MEKEKQCSDCGNNEDGLCDFLGVLVSEDDRPKEVCKEKGWQEKHG